MTKPSDFIGIENMNHSPLKTLVFFDLTHCIKNLKRQTATGIQRVDINYLHGLLNDDRFEIKGIFEILEPNSKKSLMALIDEDTVQLIHSHLYRSWILGEYSEIEFNIASEYLIKKITAIINQASFNSDVWVDTKLISAINQNKIKEKPIYLNCTWLTIPDGPQHYELITYCNFKPVYIIHDIIAIEFPEFAWGKGVNTQYLSRLLAVQKLNATVIAISDHVRQKIRSAGFHDLPILVNHNGTEDGFCDVNKEAPSATKNQFVYVSTIEPRKNHLMLLNVWRKIINSDISAEEIPTLHIIGRRGWRCEGVTAILEENASIKEYVYEHQDLSDEAMLKIISESKASLFPSFDEGWGLPIVESLALGTPVICSDISAHRECSQGHALFIDPIDGLGWYQTIMQLVKNEIKLSCEGFKPHRWSESAYNLGSTLIELDNIPS